VMRKTNLVSRTALAVSGACFMVILSLVLSQHPNRTIINGIAIVSIFVFVAAV
jgi:hypothetical protein